MEADDMATGERNPRTRRSVNLRLLPLVLSSAFNALFVVALVGGFAWCALAAGVLSVVAAVELFRYPRLTEKLKTSGLE
jgi:hypothetical protein